MDYAGQEVHPAQTMTWDQIKDSLPPERFAAKVRLLDICGGLIGEALKDPSILFTPEHEWLEPPDVQKPHWATREEWVKIARGCYQLGIFKFLRRDQLLEVNGKPVVHNLFGVGKGKTDDQGREKLRLVMNLDITN